MFTRQGAKYLWKLPQGDKKKILSIASEYNISVPIAEILYNRGYIEKDAIDSFLFSSFEKDVPHASQLKDAQKAVDRIIRALENQEKILIFGDYDVDGITSSSLMMICLLPLGARVNFYLPHRVKDGYGLSTKIVERAVSNGYTLIITVDNGITAFEPAQRAKELGIDLIITDHHRQHEHVPDAYAIINPNQFACPYPFKSLAGVGVIFKVMSLLYEQKKLAMPKKAYELLLLGTVADVVPLLGENRFWVRYGLRYVNTTDSLSFTVLKQNGKVTKPTLSSTDIGFSIAPQINALGRLQDPRQGVQFLIGSDQAEVERVGSVLFELNQTRKEIERSIVQEIHDSIASGDIDLSKENIIIAASKNWPPGVIGLVASRIVSAYGRPTILLHITKDGKAKGSCRSIPEFNMFDALTACADVLDQFGGHSIAAGLSLSLDNVRLLKERLEQRIREQLTPEDLVQKMALDAELTLPDVTSRFVKDLQQLEPFGNQNSQPYFYVRGATLVQKPQLLKDAHVKCSVFADGIIKPVIFFNRPELFDMLLNLQDNAFDLAVQVVENHWNGRVSLELQGIDIAPCSE